MKNTYHQKEISRLLNYKFKNNKLLEEALTHSSASKSSNVNNERLEFLGDRVLGLVISEELLRLNPQSTEGQIALFTHRIQHLSEHLKQNRKDFNTERSLVRLVGKRRSLLDYLKSKDILRYREIVKELGLRK